MDRSSQDPTTPVSGLFSTEASSAVTEYKLKNADSFREFLRENRENMLSQELGEYLMQLLRQKNPRRRFSRGGGAGDDHQRYLLFHPFQSFPILILSVIPAVQTAFPAHSG